jgi:hypothetical protein
VESAVEDSDEDEVDEEEDSEEEDYRATAMVLDDFGDE